MRPHPAFSSLAGLATALVLPTRCILCGEPGDGMCAACAATLPPAPDLDPPDMVDRCWSLLDYVGPTCPVVAALKFDNRHDAVGWLTGAMALLPDRRPEVVTWAPTTRRRRAARGFDQSELLATNVARRLGVPARHLLTKRSRSTQTGSSRASRLTNVEFTSAAVRHRHVLVVDDVRTTGATLSAAGDALRASGAGCVDALTLAATT